MESPSIGDLRLRGALNNLGLRRHRICELTPVLPIDTPADRVDAFVTGLPDTVAGVRGVVPGKTQACISGITADGITINLKCHLQTRTSIAESEAKTALSLEVLRFAERLGIQLGK